MMVQLTLQHVVLWSVSKLGLFDAGTLTQILAMALLTGIPIAIGFYFNKVESLARSGKYTNA